MSGQALKWSDKFVEEQRFNNYVRRMVPHAMGWFPMTAAWVIILVQLENAKADITHISDRRIPGWVDAAIYGTVIIVRHANTPKL